MNKKKAIKLINERIKEIELLKDKPRYKKEYHLRKNKMPNEVQLAVSGILIAFYFGLLMYLPEGFAGFTLNIIRIACFILAITWVVNVVIAAFALDPLLRNSAFKKWYPKSFTLCNLFTIILFTFTVASYGSYLFGNMVFYLIIGLLIIYVFKNWIKR